MTEQEYKNYIYEKAEKVKNFIQLRELLDEVLNEKLEYGTFVYAVSACMIAVARYIDSNAKFGGMTGFQASFIAWEMVREFMISNNKTGMKIIDFDNMLYPQYEENFEKIISHKVWKNIQRQAKENLDKNEFANEKVIEHWKSIVDGKVPFGYEVEEK